MIGSGATGALAAGVDPPKSGELPNSGDGALLEAAGADVNAAGTVGVGDEGAGAAIKLGGVMMPGDEGGETGDGGSDSGIGAAVTGAANISVKSPGPLFGDAGGAGGTGSRFTEKMPCVSVRDGYWSNDGVCCPSVDGTLGAPNI